MMKLIHLNNKEVVKSLMFEKGSVNNWGFYIHRNYSFLYNLTMDRSKKKKRYNLF